MFAPSLGFEGGTLLAVEVVPGPRSDQFLTWLESLGGRLHRCSSIEHDELTAILQSLTHATVLSFGLALQLSRVDVSRVMEIAPPPFLTLMCLVARITTANPEVYWEIQTENDTAKAARDAFDRQCGGRGVEGLWRDRRV